MFFMTALLGGALLLQSCGRSSNDVWEDTKSAGRHMQRGVRALAGNQSDSRQVRCRSDFECIEDNDCCPEGGFQDCDYQESWQDNRGSYYSPEGASDSYSVLESYSEDFVPLQDPRNELELPGRITPPPRETPGEEGSSIPGVQAFRDPSTNSVYASIFRPVYFGYNSDFVKGPQNLEIVHTIAGYLRSHPNTCIFIEGHTDERGPQAYNLALGARRANTVRNLLVNEGVNPDCLFTISYGKERPVVLEHHEEGWAKNRRAEFKIYEH